MGLYVNNEGGVTKVECDGCISVLHPLNPPLIFANEEEAHQKLTSSGWLTLSQLWYCPACRRENADLR